MKEETTKDTARRSRNLDSTEANAKHSHAGPLASERLLGDFTALAAATR